MNNNSTVFIIEIFCRDFGIENEYVFIFTHEVDTVGRRHRGSGPGVRPDPRPAYPSAGWGGSNRTPPSQVWGYTLGTAVLSRNKPRDEHCVCVTPNLRSETALLKPS